MTKRKVLTRVAIALLILLVVCTMLSGSIYHAMLPQVSIAEVRLGGINSELTYVGSFDYTNKQTIKAGAAWTMTEVNFKTNQKVEKGEILAKVDMTDADLTRRQLEINLNAAQKRLKNTSDKDAKVQAELAVDVAKRALEQFLASYPKDGVITAESDGRVLSCSYFTGDTVPAGAVLMDVRTEESTPIIRWEARGSEADAMDTGNGVTLSFAAFKNGSEDTYNINGSIYSKITDDLTGVTVFEARLGSFEQEIPLHSVPVITCSKTVAVGTVVPLSALTDMGGGNYLLYVVDTSQGIFGEEHVVKEIGVQKLGDDNVKAVIVGEVEENAKVATYASKPLKDGMAVAIE